jgi:uncharacterized protein (UPF0261 family)
MEAQEMKKFAHFIAEKLNKSKGPIHVLIPTRGWSEDDKEGMTLFDPEADRTFTRTLKDLLNPGIPIEEMDVHINEPSFAERAVEILDRTIKA